MKKKLTNPTFAGVIVLVALLFFPGRQQLRAAGLPEGVTNSQKPGENPPPPAESLSKIQLPKGFHVSLFAGEPDVAQPISMAFDDRGRLWVAECYSYKKWQAVGRDRILVFDDTDKDGRFDERKIFADKLANLTAIELGFGGVWACCAPKLLFFPDADRDDRPDSGPEVKLVGWDTEKVSHNIVNGLTWGPDGWLYGCHGIQGQSDVGTPDTRPQMRTALKCGIWRYHPVKETFEVVAHGTTNPWGLDFDEYGQGFFTNCVIGHLWHLIPGAHYKRMYGEDFNPHVYALMSQCSDHLHWGGGKWNDSGNGERRHSIAGGGHAHVGAMIYLGDNWPERYRGTLFTCNLHGNRLNNDILKRKGSGYVATHGRDFLLANDPWFRGLEAKYGPDGGVFINDWCDFGECHDNDGVHRTSGRIYKVVYGKPGAVKGKLDLATLTNGELVKLQSHKNAWYPRHARRLLHERAAVGRDMSDVRAAVERQWLNEKLDTAARLRSLWTLNVSGCLDAPRVAKLLTQEDEHLRSWAVRWLSEQPRMDDAVIEALAGMAANDQSSLVRLHLASALQRMTSEHRWLIAERLASHAEDADDQNLPLMIWYGIEPLVPVNKKRAIALAAKCKIPLVRQYIARRVAAL
ncbi:MAG: PVC-type heme-binding CxxCH protein [Pirellulales bacterium]